MMKAFGYLAMIASLILGIFLGGFSPGFAIWFLSVFFVMAGTLAVFLLQLPAGLEPQAMNQLIEPRELGLAEVAKEIFNLASVVRRDGLLAAEAIRRDLKDPLLKYLMKRVMEGYEKLVLLPIIQNKNVRHEQLFSLLQNYFDRCTQMVPLVGLLGTLAQVISYFSRPVSAGTPPDPTQIASFFIPFLSAIVLQILIQTIYQARISRARDQSLVYYSMIAQGISGIQDGVNAEVLADKIAGLL